MDCNKDEAFKAKEIAEKKLLNNDIQGAKRFALEVKSLYPRFEGIDKMISTIDIHLVAGEEPHKILQVDKSAGLIDLRKQYIKLALQLHPDKNKSVGASGAFQIVLNAYNTMCEEAKKYLIDQSTNGTMFQRTTQETESKPFATPNSSFNGCGAKATPEAPGNNQHHGDTPKVAPTRTPPSVPRGKEDNQQNGKAPNDGPSTSSVPRGSKQKYRPSKSESNTRGKKAKSEGSKPRGRYARENVEHISFWTSCDKCSMLFEYRRIYLKHNLVCCNCRTPFIAFEIKTASMS